MYSETPLRTRMLPWSGIALNLIVEMRIIP